MAQRGERGSIATLICDSGERYADTLFNEEWRDSQDWLERDPHPETAGAAPARSKAAALDGIASTER